MLTETFAVDWDYLGNTLFFSSASTGLLCFPQFWTASTNRFKVLLSFEASNVN